MLYEILLTLFIILCLLMILIILIQKGKSSAGVGGGFGGGAQTIFGGSGGQDIFQKITWVMGALFLSGSLILAMMKYTQVNKARYLENVQVAQPILPAVPASQGATSTQTQNTQSDEDAAQ